MVSLGDERKFLHDLSNPLAIAHGNLKILLRHLEKENIDLDAEDYRKRLQYAFEACDRLADLLVERRRQLIAESDKVESRS